MAKQKSYGSIEEEPIDEDPVHAGHTDLPDPEEYGDVDPEIGKKLAQAKAAAREQRLKAELG